MVIETCIPVTDVKEKRKKPVSIMLDNLSRTLNTHMTATSEMMYTHGPFDRTRVDSDYDVTVEDVKVAINKDFEWFKSQLVTFFEITEKLLVVKRKLFHYVSETANEFPTWSENSKNEIVNMGDIKQQLYDNLDKGLNNAKDVHERLMTIEDTSGINDKYADTFLMGISNYYSMSDPIIKDLKFSVKDIEDIISSNSESKMSTEEASKFCNRLDNINKNVFISIFKFSKKLKIFQDILTFPKDGDVLRFLEAEDFDYTKIGISKMVCYYRNSIHLLIMTLSLVVDTIMYLDSMGDHIPSIVYKTSVQFKPTEMEI